MAINLKDLKLISDAAPREPEDPASIVKVIIKVRVEDYIPTGVKLRAKIGPYLYTAECPAGELARVEADKNVESVARAVRVGLI